MKKELETWYKSINEEDILPNGLIKVPLIMQNEPEIIGQTETQNEPEIIGQTETQNEPEIINQSIIDPVIAKDKDSSLKAFILAKRIQDSLVRLAGLIEPYESDSETRQKSVDHIKKLFSELGEVISIL